MARVFPTHKRATKSHRFLEETAFCPRREVELLSGICCTMSGHNSRRWMKVSNQVIWLNNSSKNVQCLWRQRWTSEMTTTQSVMEYWFFSCSVTMLWARRTLYRLYNVWSFFSSGTRRHNKTPNWLQPQRSPAPSFGRRGRRGSGRKPMPTDAPAAPTRA